MAAGLKRSISLLDVIGLGVNAVIGQGIFLLPGLAAAIVGPAAILALLLAAALAFLIALCFAEVGGRFEATGGAYVYAREAFGPFVGFEVGWMLCCVGIISWAALANGFTVVLARFIPAVGEGWLQPVVAIGLMTALMAVNMFGAKMGASVSTFFSVAKLLPMLAFIAVGLMFIDGELYAPFTPKGLGGLGEATLLLLYAFVGFESAVVPAGEMKDPQKAVPIALVTVMSVVCVVYAAIFMVTVGTLPEVAGHGNPVAAASERFMGPVGGVLIAAGIVVSVFGINSGAALVSPRKIYALAERGDLPGALARVDEKSGAPRAAIFVTFIIAAGLSLTGSFKDLALLGVVARFVQYIPTCLAVLVLRERRGPAAGFKVPLGPVIPLAAVGLCIWLIANTAGDKILGGLIALALGIPFYLLARRRQRASQA
jgi:amino acid transporter